MTQDYMAAIQAIADKLDKPVTMLWGAMVRQAPISASVTLLFDLFGFLIAGAFVWLAYKETKNVLDPFGDPISVILCIFAALAVLITFAATAGNAEYIIAGFVNPQYWALMRLTGKC